MATNFPDVPIKLGDTITPMVGFNPADPISSSSLASTSTPNFQSPQQTPIYNVAGLNQPLTATEPEKKATDLTTQLQELNNQLIGQSDEQAKQEQALGIPDLTRTQNDLSARLKALQNEALAIPLQLQQENIGRGVTEGGLRPIQTAALRNNAIQALSVNSLLEASRGNLSLAQDMADRAVAQKFDPIKERIAVARANLDLIINSPEYSLADKNRAQAQKAIQDERARQIQKQEAIEAEKGKALLEYAGIADGVTLREMQNAPDAVGVLQIALQRGLVTPEQAKAKLDARKTEAEIARINADTELTNTQKAKILAETSVNTVNAKKMLQNNEAYTLAKALRKSDAPGKGAALGASFAKFVPYGRELGLQGARTAYEAKVNTLKSNLTLENLQLLKGAMSDKDLLFLNSIGSSLDVNMLETEFDKELDRIIKKLEDAGATSVEDDNSIVDYVPEGYYKASDGLYYKK